MSQWRKGPATLYFEARKYFFWLRWTETALHIEAVNKGELTKCFKGELKSDQKTLKELYQFLQIHSYRESLTESNVDEISLVMTIIDLTEEGKGYACRFIFNDSIKEVKVQPVAVSETYFLTKKIQAMEYEKKNDRMLMAEFGTEIARKMEAKDEDIKKTLAEQMQGMISALASQIQRKLDSREKRKKDDNEDTGEGLDMKRIEKKLRKKIKKQLKERKREKKHQKKEKRKKRKERRKQKRRLQALLAEGKIDSGQLLLHQTNIQDGLEDLQRPSPNNLLNFPFQDQDPNNFLNVDDDEGNPEAIAAPEQQKKNKRKKDKKEKKEKHRQERPQNPPLVMQPQVTSLNSMAKLRNRGGDLYIPVRAPEPIEIVDEGREKKNKDKKNKKQKKKNKEKEKEVQELQQVEEAGEKEYYKRLEQIRRVGDIDQVRAARANRNKPILAPPKQPLNEIDQFNPKYNGEPRYKSFISMNEYQTVRPGEIFVPRMQQASGECKRIPAIFREEIPTFKFFEVSGCVVRKLSGTKYHQMVFDYCVPQTGRHVVTMRLIQSKRSYLWFGVVDLREKDRQESFNQKNCITFSFRTGHVATSNKWTRPQMARVEAGLSVRMQVDMDKNCVTWHVSDGRNSIATIPKLMRKLTLAPYFQMMDAGDEVCFEE